ncbi:hypothetical protein BGLA2_510032 [Burkholderia gladioli]|nr:hypothetical protein BGLA2_510032 [Burkholderia gladioli]
MAGALSADGGTTVDGRLPGAGHALPEGGRDARQPAAFALSNRARQAKTPTVLHRRRFCSCRSVRVEKTTPRLT